MVYMQYILEELNLEISGERKEAQSPNYSLSNKRCNSSKGLIYE